MQRNSRLMFSLGFFFFLCCLFSFKALLKLLHAIVTEFVNLNTYDKRQLKRIGRKLKEMEDNVEFVDVVLQIKELIR